METTVDIMKNENFVLDLFEPKKLKRINENGQRLYVTESGERYPSVTTALGKIGKKKIYEWRRRVGAEQANKISTQASRAGTAVHNIAEQYMLGELDVKKANPVALNTFRTIQPYIDNNIDLVNGVELQMYSHELMTAGTADLLCRYNGKHTLLDFKTSRRVKKKEDITTYFMQCAAYSIMAKEHYDHDIEQIVILMALHDGDPIVFIEDINGWIPMTKKYFDLYHRGKLNSF